jgi:hypothetical protein
MNLTNLTKLPVKNVPAKNMSMCVSPISVEKWNSREHVQFEIKNNSKKTQLCQWFARSDKVEFVSVPGPFYLKPGEERIIRFKQRHDPQYKGFLKTMKKFEYTVLFKLTGNEKTLFEDQQLCSHYTYSPEVDVYFTSFLLPPKL